MSYTLPTLSSTKKTQKLNWSDLSGPLGTGIGPSDIGFLEKHPEQKLLNFSCSKKPIIAVLAAVRFSTAMYSNQDVTIKIVN